MCYNAAFRLDTDSTPMIRSLKTCFRLSVFTLVSAAFAVSAGSLQAQMPGTRPGEITTLQQMQAKEAAQAAATTWLRLLDTGMFAETWQTAATSFHSAITQDGWITLLKGGRPVFGDVVTRKLKAVTFTRILTGAPDGQYVVILYDTEFTKMKAAVETVTTGLQPDGSWKVDGYHIK